MIEIKEKGKYNYIDEGKGEPIILLHGLFGALSNWDAVVKRFSTTNNVVIPLLPIYEMPLRQASVEGLEEYFSEFVDLMEYKSFTLMGNSLGGHVALVYTLNNPDKVSRLVLAGSSGLFENSMGGSFPKRGNYAYIEERVGYTFYDPKICGKSYIDEVFEITNSIQKCLRIVAIAKSAQRHNMAKELKRIKAPTLLVWGLNDTITPPMVAHEFNKLISNTTLRFIDKCCHAPMMEQPEVFNKAVEEFITT